MSLAAAPEIGQAIDDLLTKLWGWAHGFVQMVPNLLLAALVIAIGVVLSGFVSRFFARMLTRGIHNEPLARLLSSLVRVALIALAILGGLSLLHLDKTVTSLLAGVGVIGLALGFAFQDIAANFMSGFIMAAQRPFKPGDTVELAGKKCKVVSVRLRATHAQTLDGLSIIVPNKDVFQNPIINYSTSDKRRMELVMGVGYADDLEKVQRVAVSAVLDLEHRDDTREPELYFTGFGDSAIDAQLRVWLIASSELALIQARSAAIVRIKKAFDAEGITLPFPIRTLDFGAKIVGGERLDQMRLGDVARAAGPSSSRGSSSRTDKPERDERTSTPGRPS